MEIIRVSASLDDNVGHKGKPFAFSIHLVFAEGDVLQFILCVGFSYPAANVVVGRPPEQFRDEKRGCGIRVSWSVLGRGNLLAFLALLDRLLVGLGGSLTGT